jgi:hypothetical protein
MFLYGDPVRAASIYTTALQPAQYHGLHGLGEGDSELNFGRLAGKW